ncbi:hypothetical protein L2E82_39900 [Cichorium intybus]|uniref:Uncharacterized protein n=1 Tax=Cichorium intybus TaxID=13427 RepID=A0ACB9AKV3_CICIN|nr:hypothetical protein L2E82_39900 [Cichorium intybus]
MHHAAELAWHEMRRAWFGDRSQTLHTKFRHTILSWTISFQDLIASAEPFPDPVPLAENEDMPLKLENVERSDFEDDVEDLMKAKVEAEEALRDKMFESQSLKQQMGALQEAVEKSNKEILFTKDEHEKEKESTNWRSLMTEKDVMIRTLKSELKMVRDKFPHIQDYKAFKVPTTLDPKNILKDQLGIAFFDPNGRCISVTGLKLPGVLDDIFSYLGPLGAIFSNEIVSLCLWAPTAQDVRALIYNRPSGGEPLEIVKLNESNGVWSVNGPRNWEGCYYVQSDHFDEFFALDLDKHGYQAFYKKKTAEVSNGSLMTIDGFATFFRRDSSVGVSQKRNGSYNGYKFELLVLKQRIALVSRKKLTLVSVLNLNLRRSCTSVTPYLNAISDLPDVADYAMTIVDG